ncbi:MAG: efflux RND transporter periplasmic adaptor subunit [Ruminococcus sp.]|nr:efflux RND transporter periplasmic adaptor subunit [Ruminococcus sp.]
MKKGKKAAIITICSIAAVAVGGSAVYAAVSSKPETEGSAQTVEVEKMDLKQCVTVTGTVKSGESSSLVSELLGTEIKSVDVKVGDRVKKGDVIAVLDDTDLQEQLAKAEKMLASAEERNNISISAAKRMYDTAVSDKNTNSQRGSKSVDYARSIYNKAVDQQDEAYRNYNEAVDAKNDAEYEAEQAAQTALEAAGAVEAIQSALDEAKNNFGDIKNNYESVMENTEASGDEKNSAKAAFDEASSAISGLEAQLKEANTASKAAAEYAKKAAEMYTSALMAEKELKGVRTAADNAVDEAKHAIDTANDTKAETEHTYDSTIASSADNLKTAELSTDDAVAEIEEQIKTIKKNIEKCTVKADMDGIITEVNVKAGETYSGAVIAVIQDDSSYKIEAAADQYDISKLEKGLPTEITVQAVSSIPMSGSLSFVAPTPQASAMAMESASSTDYTIEAVFDNNEDKLRLGMTAKLNIIVGESKDVLAVPESCIYTDEDGKTFIEVNGSGDSTERVYVECGLKNDYYTEVSGEGLKEGMEVITSDSDEDSKSFY